MLTRVLIIVLMAGGCERTTSRSSCADCRKTNGEFVVCPDGEECVDTGRDGWWVCLACAGVEETHCPDRGLRFRCQGDASTECSEDKVRVCLEAAGDCARACVDESSSSSGVVACQCDCTRNNQDCLRGQGCSDASVDQYGGYPGCE